MRRFVFFLLVCFLVFGACRKGEEGVLIGIAGPMTGPQAKMGMDFRNGVNMAVEAINGRGGVLGKKVAVMVGDDGADPKQAVAVANRLVNAGAVGVIGHFNSSCSIPASDVYDRAGIPMISPASTNPKLTERGLDGVFRVCGRDDQQGKVAAEFVLSGLDIKKAAVIHDKTTYGQGLAEEFIRFLGDGVEVVYEGGIVQGDKDFKMVLTAIKQKGPELVYFGGIYPEAGLLVKQARELAMEVPFMSGDGAIDRKFIEIAGAEAAEGTFLTFSPDPENIPSAKEFIEKYRAKYGEPGPYSIYAYDATNILFEAMAQAGSTEGPKVIEKLRLLEFPGALGNVRFDEKGDVMGSPYVVWITEGGVFREYWKGPK